MNANDQTQDALQLRLWFRDRLDRGDVHFDREALSYEANTEYDRLFYRLQAEAREAWLQRYGYAPTPGQLTQAFFDAEFDRFRAGRLARKPLLKRLLARLR
jgi:hypothetical protein